MSDMAGGPVSAHDVAAEIRRRLPGVPTKKLHKLLYYCQGHHLGTFGAPLFTETISAWDMGPVVGELWYREGRREPLPSGRELTEAQLNTVGYVLSRYGALTGTGSYAPPPEARGGKFKGSGVGPSPAYSYAAQVAEVSVDEETGVVTVDKVWAAHDCGRALNPVSVEGQVIGSVWMGLGQALQEEMVWKDGLLMNPSLLEYRSPSAVESPEVECIIVESVDPEGPFGAKEASEGSLAATIPAIANAMYDAVGVRLREAPFTPERVLAALRAQRPAEKKLDLTEGVDPTAPARFREHGGALWFKGKGPMRHAVDPARRAAAPSPAHSEGDD
jgi:hypothetical protein